MTYKESYHDPEWLQEIVKKYLKSKSLNLCCGQSRFGDVRADNDPNVKPDVECDIFDLPFERAEFDSIYCDPVWEEPRFWCGFKGMKNKYMFLCNLRDLLKTNGVLIWNCNWAYDYIKGLKTIYRKYNHSRVSGLVTCTMVYKRVNGQLEEYEMCKQI